MASDDIRLSNRASRVFTSCAPFVGGCGGRSGGGFSHSGGGILRRGEGVVLVGEVFVDEGPEMGGGGLRSLRMKRPLVLKPAVGSGGRSFAGLGERESFARSLVLLPMIAAVGLPRKRRTPFILSDRCSEFFVVVCKVE